MIYETHNLMVAEAPATLTVYAPDNSPEIDPDRIRPAIVMCPGGGYGMCSDREAEPVASSCRATGCVPSPKMQA